VAGLLAEGAYDGDDADKGFITRYSSARCDRTPNVWDWLFKQSLAGR
jgi:hypothetical protein